METKYYHLSNHSKHVGTNQILECYAKTDDGTHCWIMIRWHFPNMKDWGWGFMQDNGFPQLLNNPNNTHREMPESEWNARVAELGGKW